MRVSFSCWMNIKTSMSPEVLRAKKTHTYTHIHMCTWTTELSSAPQPASQSTNSLAKLSSAVKLNKVTCAKAKLKCKHKQQQGFSRALVLLSYVVQIMHFWIETVNKKSQEAFPILQAMARMLYKLCGLRYLILVFNILFTWCQGFKSIQSLLSFWSQI